MCPFDIGECGFYVSWSWVWKPVKARHGRATVIGMRASPRRESDPLMAEELEPGREIPGVAHDRTSLCDGPRVFLFWTCLFQACACQTLLLSRPGKPRSHGCTIPPRRMRRSARVHSIILTDKDRGMPVAEIAPSVPRLPRPAGIGTAAACETQSRYRMQGLATGLSAQKAPSSRNRRFYIDL